MRQLILEDETATELSALLTASLHESMSTILSLQFLASARIDINLFAYFGLRI